MSVLEQNKQIVRDYFNAFLAADERWWRDHIAPAFRRHDPGLPFDVMGPAGVKQLADALLPGIPDMQLPIEDLVAEGGEGAGAPARAWTRSRRRCCRRERRQRGPECRTRKKWSGTRYPMRLRSRCCLSIFASLASTRAGLLPLAVILACRRVTVFVDPCGPDRPSVFPVRRLCGGDRWFQGTRSGLSDRQWQQGVAMEQHTLGTGPRIKRDYLTLERDTVIWKRAPYMTSNELLANSSMTLFADVSGVLAAPLSEADTTAPRLRECLDCGLFQSCLRRVRARWRAAPAAMACCAARTTIRCWP
jgi:hypothetical protein